MMWALQAGQMDVLNFTALLKNNDICEWTLYLFFIYKLSDNNTL